MRFAPTLIGLCVVLSSSISYGDVLAFSTEFNSGGSPKFSIDNRSVGNWFIESVEVDLTAANVVFDTTAADGIGTDPVDTPTAFLGTGTYGSFSTAVTAAGLAAYDNAGSVPGLIGDINGGGTAGRDMSFAFSTGGIAVGDGWGGVVDWDEVGSNDAPRGSDMTGAIVTATFINPAFPGFKQTLSLIYAVNGNGVSFPGFVSANAIPEPSTLGVCSLLLFGFVAVRRRRRKAIAK